MRRGRSGAGEWREFGEVGTDGAPPRTPEVTGGGRPRTPEVTGGGRPRTPEATGGGRPRTPWRLAGEPRAGGGDFNGNQVVYRGGDFGIICRR